MTTLGQKAWRVETASRLVSTAIITLGGLGWGIGWALIPARDQGGGCGTPAVTAFLRYHDSFDVSCQHQDVFHLAVGVVGGALITWLGLVLMLVPVTADRPATRVRRRRAVLAVVALVMVGASMGAAGAETYRSNTWVASDGPAG